MALHMKMINCLSISKSGVLIFDEQLFLWWLLLVCYDCYNSLKLDCIVRFIFNLIKSIMLGKSRNKYKL